MSKFTFKTEDGLYDVEKLNDSAKTAFNYLAEIQAEIQGLNKRIDVLNAASVAYNSAIMDNLDDEAMIEEEEVQEVE
jgi:uncharacterized protein YkvS